MSLLSLIAILWLSICEAAEPGDRGIVTTPTSPASTTNSRFWAVVIGVSDYAQLDGTGAGHGLRDLAFADADADAVAAFLRSDRFIGGGIPDDQIRVLTNAEASLVPVRIALKGFLSRAGSEDVVVVFFAGHGVPDPRQEDEIILMTHDTSPDPEALAGSGLGVSEILADVGAVRAAKVLLLLDACHAGLATEGTRGDAGASVVQRALRQFQNAAGQRLVFASSGASQLSQEHTRWRLPGFPGTGHGVFTYALLSTLMPTVDEVPEDGIVRLGEVLSRVQETVQRETEGAQRPRHAGQFDLDLPLAVHPRPAAALLAAREASLEQQAWLDAAREAWSELNDLERFSPDDDPMAEFDALHGFLSRFVPAPDGERNLPTPPQVELARARLLERARAGMFADLPPATVEVLAARPSGRPRGRILVDPESPEVRLRAPALLEIRPGYADLQVLTSLPEDPLTRVPIVHHLLLRPGESRTILLRDVAQRPALTRLQRTLLGVGGGLLAAGAGAVATTAILTHGGDAQQYNDVPDGTARALNGAGWALAGVGAAITITPALLTRSRRFVVEDLVP